MARTNDRQLLRIGAITIMVLALALAAAFNLQRLPGMRGSTYHAEFADASGLKVGDTVEVAGIRVGRVDAIRIDGDRIRVDFDVKGAHLGGDTSASIRVLNLLGQKYLELQPEGVGTLDTGATIPLSRTTAGYDIVSTLDELTDTGERIDTKQLSTALTTLASTMDQASPEIRGTFSGLARLSRTVASRSGDIDKLLTHAQHVVRLVDDRKQDMVGLMAQGTQIFEELITRRQDIHDLLVNATSLSHQLEGLAKDNEKQIGPALDELDTAITFLNKRKQELSDTIKNYGPYASILINIIGTGPWFDAYVPNLTSLATGEFVPGHRPGLK